MRSVELAQLNIARAVAPLDDPLMDGFVTRLAEINGLAERSPGFVWRLTDVARRRCDGRARVRRPARHREPDGLDGHRSPVRLRVPLARTSSCFAPGGTGSCRSTARRSSCGGCRPASGRRSRRRVARLDHLAAHGPDGPRVHDESALRPGLDRAGSRAGGRQPGVTGTELFLAAAILITFCIIAGWSVGGRRRERFVAPPPSWWVCPACHSVNNADDDLPLTCYRCGREADPAVGRAARDLARVRVDSAARDDAQGRLGSRRRLGRGPGRGSRGRGGPGTRRGGRGPGTYERHRTR